MNEENGALLATHAPTGAASTSGIPLVEMDPGWCLALDGLDPAREPAREALVALANGSIGVSGAPLASHGAGRRWTLVNGLYDGEGPGSGLIAGPVGLHLPYQITDGASLRRILDLRAGLLSEEVTTDAGPVHALRFTSLADPHLVVVRATTPDDRTAALLEPATNGSVNGHGWDGDVAWMVAGAEDGVGGLAVAALERRISVNGFVMRDRVIAHAVDVHAVPAPDVAIARARAAADAGFDSLLADHRSRWAQRWDDADIVIEGDDELQLAVRFALFHLIGSVPSEGEAAVGARGLTGAGYRGHVFWDADTFTLPFVAATCPPAARAMLAYRVARIPAGRVIAQTRHRAGCRFPWESARSGFDVTPTFARDRTGRVVPIRTGQLQEHIVAEVPWAAACYGDWTGDDEFACGPGMALLIDSARYWRSRIRRDAEGAAHIYGVIGPDEYHEPVDDNAFTNIMARWNLRRAAAAVDAERTRGGDVDHDEVQAWRACADALVDGYDVNTGIYEQFAGFHRLEPLLIAEAATSRPVAADVLLGTDRVAGAQVLKQADVLMVHHLLPDEAVPGTLEANVRFYEPRTAHGSSLSPAIHASLFARARDFPSALESLRLASRIDLDDLTGSSALGMHIATMGGLWQAMVVGFAGIRPVDECLGIDPRLPPGWGSLAVRVRFRGSRVLVAIAPDHLTIHADPLARVRVGSGDYSVGQSGLRWRPRGADWDLLP